MLFPPTFEEEIVRLMREKLGLQSTQEGDSVLINELMQMLGKLNLDFTYFFRTLSYYELGQRESLKPLWEYYGQRQELIQWLLTYDDRLAQEKDDKHRQDLMLRSNPKYILRNYIAQEVIEDVEADESQKLESWLKVLYSPFDEHPEFEKYSLPTPPELKDFEVSCSS